MKPMRRIGLPPVARSDARLFILGSLPGEASLAAKRYYAHPTNQFWRLLGAAIGEELQPRSYEQRLERLADRRIGLWDVMASANRRGSLDQAIREAEHNRVEILLHEHSDLRAIAFNGMYGSRISLSSRGSGVSIMRNPAPPPARLYQPRIFSG